MKSKTSLTSTELESVAGELSAANKEFMRRYPGESDRRQAVHTVYGGAHLFKADSARRLGEVALRSLKEYAPDAETLAAALGIKLEAALMQKIYDRIVEKLKNEPVEDFRLDFEDGYGNRPDEEEDGHAHPVVRDRAPPGVWNRAGLERCRRTPWQQSDASAPARLSTVARHAPFSAKRITRNPNQRVPCAPYSRNVERASTASKTIRNGLRARRRSDHTPAGNCNSPAKAASVETKPMVRLDMPCWRRYSGR